MSIFLLHFENVSISVCFLLFSPFGLLQFFRFYGVMYPVMFVAVFLTALTGQMELFAKGRYLPFLYFVCLSARSHAHTNTPDNVEIIGFCTVMLSCGY